VPLSEAELNADEKDGEDSEDSGEGSEGWNDMLIEAEDDGLGMDIDIY
jgi:hypothetical protein